jgi:hypothetical protein
MLSELTTQQDRSRAMFATGEISQSEYVGMRLQLNALSRARLDAVISAQQAALRLEDALQQPMNMPIFTRSRISTQGSEVTGSPR